VTGGLWPDLTLLLLLPAAEGLARAERRARERQDSAKGETRFEAHDANFHDRIARFFAGLPEAEPARCVSIDAGGDEDSVALRIHEALQARSWA